MTFDLDLLVFLAQLVQLIKEARVRVKIKKLVKCSVSVCLSGC